MPSIASRTRRLTFASAVNLLVVAVQVAGGVAAHSLGLLADAGHGLIDVGVLALAAFAAWLGRREPTPTRSFGYHRSAVLAAQVNSLLIVAVTVVLAVFSIRRLIHPVAVAGSLVLPIALVAVVGNLVAAGPLLRGGHGGSERGERVLQRDLNVRAAIIHLLGDAGASLGVAVAGLAIWLTGGLEWLDPAVSLGIGVLIGYQAIVLVKEATDVLLESTPAGLDTDALATAIAEVTGVDAVHDLHAWSLSPEVRALSAHLVLSGHPTLEEAQVVADRVKATVSSPFDLAHVTLELECEACVTDGSDPCAMAMVSDNGAERAGPSGGGPSLGD